MSKKGKFALLITLTILLFLMALYLTWSIATNIATLAEYTSEDFPPDVAQIFIPRLITNIIFNLICIATSVASAIVFCMLIAKLYKTKNEDE